MMASWTEQEIETVYRLRAEGMPNADICERLGITCGRLSRLIHRLDLPKRAPSVARTTQRSPRRFLRGEATLSPWASLQGEE
jgi:hypothetical protein